jgi:hypothetical protein
MRVLAVEIHEDLIEQYRYLKMALLREHKKLKLEQIIPKPHDSRYRRGHPPSSEAMA